VSIPIMKIHLRVAKQSKIHRLPVTLHYRELMHNCQVRDGSFKAIPRLDSVNGETPYGHTTSCYHCL